MRTGCAAGWIPACTFMLMIACGEDVDTSHDYKQEMRDFVQGGKDEQKTESQGENAEDWSIEFPTHGILPSLTGSVLSSQAANPPSSSMVLIYPRRLTIRARAFASSASGLNP